MRLPAIKLDFLKNFTDDTGIFQHGKYCIPNRSEGYTTDDNARALIVCAQYNDLKNDKGVKELANTYLAFLNYMQKPDGGFHNYLGYDRRYLDVDGSEDCFGRALWGCGRAVNSLLPSDSRLVAKDIFDKSLPLLYKSISIRANAFMILGLYNCFKAAPKGYLFTHVEDLANGMVQQYKNQARADWQWFEPYLTYDNARLPQALFEAYMVTKKPVYLNVARESLDFIIKTQIIEEKFVPIGNNGWYTRGCERAVYDQQPVEATALVDAAADAYYATGDTRYLNVAALAFEWFLGRNTRKLPLYNPETAGCFDGLMPVEVNRNQGAESSISYLMARLKMDELRSVGQKKNAMDAAGNG